jgi:hypothetical protein
MRTRHLSIWCGAALAALLLAAGPAWTSDSSEPPPPPIETPVPPEMGLSARPEDAAALTAPAAGSTLPGATVTFNWSAGTGVAGYYIMVGEWAGGNTLFERNMGTQRSVTVEGLPTDGRMIYVRLWSLLDGEWESRDAQFRAAGVQTPARAELTAPAPGAVLPGASANFEWSAGAAVRRYYLFVGLWPGGNTLFSRDMEQARGATVANLPAAGQTIYVRLWSLIDDEWIPFDAIYTAAGTPAQAVKAQLTSPAPGSMLTGATATFNWSEGTGVRRYYFFAGLWQGGNTLASVDADQARSATVSNLPVHGETIWIRVWSLIGEDWEYNDYQVRAFDANPGPPTQAELTAPAPGSTLTGSTAQFVWSAGRGVERYFLFIGNWAGDNSIANIDGQQNLSATITNLPVDGRLLFVRVWSYIGGEWLSNDYTVRAFRE